MLRKLKKPIQMILLGTAFTAFLPIWAFASSPEEISAQALALAGEEDHSGALALLNSQDPEVRDTYDVRFTKARILAWAKEYDKSSAEYMALMADFPGNPDIQNGFGYLEYYRGNLDQAEYHFNQVLAGYPGYEDASNGLNRVAAARADKKSEDYSWRMDVNAGLSSFDNGQEDWNSQSIRVEHRPGGDLGEIAGGLAIYGSADRFERFGLNDIQFFGGVRTDNDENWDLDIGAGFTPDADFRAEFTGRGRAGYKFELEGDTVLHASLGYQFDDYAATGSVHQISPQIMAYLENGMVLTTRLIHVMQDGESNQTGFLATGLMPVSGRLNARIGYANAPEAVNGVVIDTESLFGGLSYRLNENLELHGTYSRDDRDGFYIRDGYNVGLTQKY